MISLCRGVRRLDARLSSRMREISITIAVRSAKNITVCHADASTIVAKPAPNTV